ncbi:cobalt-zinc-cadmium efflux system membrane fusion protein [Oxalobacteraceae bacterium GrIS 2.11]
MSFAERARRPKFSAINKNIDLPIAMTMPSTLSLSRKTKAMLLAGAVLALGVAMLAIHFADNKPEIKTAPAAAPAPGTFRPSKGQLESLKIVAVQAMNFRAEQITDGAIANNDDATTPVFSPYSGHVTKLFAKLGDVVNKGAPLMAVEANEFVQGQNDLISMVGALNTARAQLQLTEASEQRQHDLYLAKAGAQKDWLQSQSDLTAARNTLRSAEIAVGAVRNRLRILGKSDDEISVMEAETGLQKTNPEAVVRAPIAGTVILRQVGVGQNIQSATAGAANPVYAIANLSTVWLVANVRETDAPQMKLGAPIEVTVQAWPGRMFKAKIAWIAPSVDPNTHRLPVRAEVDNRDGALKPMMFASFRIFAGDSVSAPGVPQSAVVYEGADAHVFVAGADGSLALRPIQTGRVNGDMVEASSGLAAGEKIVTSGALFIDRAAESN